MKMKFGAIVTEGSGKIGGHVASKNRGGAYLRTKVTPSNPKTGAQAQVRDRLSSLSQSWRELTQVQRDAWNAAVSSFKRTNIFGDLKEPSGFNLYQRMNNNILTVGGTAIDMPPLPTTVATISNPVITAAVAVPALSLAFDIEAGVDAGYKVFATPPTSPGKKNVNSNYRLIKVGAVDPVSPLNLLTAYTAKFGSVGEIGQKIDVKIVACGSNSGVESVPVTASVITIA